MLAIFDLFMIYMFLAAWMIVLIYEDPFYFKKKFTCEASRAKTIVRLHKWAKRLNFFCGIVLSVRITHHAILWMLANYENNIYLCSFILYTVSLLGGGFLILLFGKLVMMSVDFIDHKLGKQHGPEEEVEKHEVQPAVPRLRQAVQ